MAAAQSEMDPIRKDSDNPQTRSRYASYAAMDRAVRPTYTAHGFCLSFNTEDIPTAEEVRVICYVSRGGFTRKYQVEMPTDGKGLRGNDAMTKTHAYGSGVTYGRRYLLAMIFNLATTDDDGNAAGGKTYMGAPVANRQQAADRVVEVKSENPVPPPVINARTLPLQPGENMTQWTDRYVAALGSVKTASDLAALKDGNAMLLGKVVVSTAEQAKPSQEKLRKADAEARKRVTEARPTSAHAAGTAEPASPAPASVSTSASPASTASSKPAAVIDNPEAFVKDMFLRIDQCETPEAVDVIYQRDIWPHEGELLQPDVQALLQRMRHRKAALTP